MEDLSQEYGISIDDIIKYALCDGNVTYIESYKKVLQQKEKLWIGRIKCSKEFASKYAELILNSASRVSSVICSKYDCKNNINDMASDAMEYILLSSGQIEKNFDGELDVKKAIESYMGRHIKYKCLENIKEAKKISYDDKFNTSKGEGDSLQKQLKDDRTNTEAEAIRKIGKETLEKKCAKLVMRGIKGGLDKKQALIEASKALGIKPAEALTIMKEMQAKRKKTKADSEIGE